jgi:hypothetical protein
VDFAALKTELSDRGFARLTDARRGIFVNEGRRKLDNLCTWPYRLASASGAAPLTIADLGVIEEVLNTAAASAPLDFMDRRSILDAYGELTTVGAPQVFYIDNGIVRTYPVGGTLAVRYYKRTPVLVNGTDTPLAPADYHLLYVDLAEVEARGGKDVPLGDLPARVQQKILEMADDLFGQQVQGPSVGMSLTFASDDW